MPPTATTVETESPTRVGVNRLVKYGLLTVLVAVIANALVRVIAVSVITVPAGFWPLGWGAVIISTVITAVGATIVYGGITRISQRPNRTFTIVAVVVLVLSFGSFNAFIAPAPSLVGTQASLRLLALMHVITAVVIIGILTRVTKSRQR